MQWLIDIIKDWIGVRGNLPAGYVNRGDPGAYDFVIGNFTVDNAWHELDLSAIVPEHATAVDLFVLGANVSSAKELIFRRHDNTNRFAIDGIRTVIAGLTEYANPVISLDETRIIEYMATTPAWAAISLAVKGWWF